MEMDPNQRNSRTVELFRNILIMGISKLPSMKDYWSSNSVLGNGKEKEIITRDRFFPIL